jgi:integrase
MIGFCRAQKAPAVVAPGTLRGKRDRALILLGYAGAFRRSELVAIDLEHLAKGTEGLQVRIARSNTDTKDDPPVVSISRVPGSPYCPVQARYKSLDVLVKCVAQDRGNLKFTSHGDAPRGSDSAQDTPQGLRR